MKEFFHTQEGSKQIITNQFNPVMGCSNLGKCSKLGTFSVLLKTFLQKQTLQITFNCLNMTEN